MQGLIHVYCGDGKGKTTAAAGLSVRASGAGRPVLFVQFFKNGNSSEIRMLKDLPNVRVAICETSYGFIWTLSEEEKARAAADYTALFRGAAKEAAPDGLLVLDEIISAMNFGMVPEEEVLDFLREKPEELEVVLTGRDPSEKILEAADYVTEMKKIKHPFDRGVQARKGIEF